MKLYKKICQPDPDSVMIIIKYCRRLFAQAFASFAVKLRTLVIKKAILLFTHLLLGTSVFTQESTISETVISIAEELAADETSPESAELFIELLSDLAENPVQINKADEKEISRLFFLTDFQVRSMADYTRSSGNIISIYEIALIPGFDRQTAELMSRFITFGKPTGTEITSSRLKNNLLTNIILKSGEADTSQPGSQVKILSKYKLSAGRFSVGITAEKDPGEKLISGTPPLPDYLSAYLSFSGSGVIKKVIIGDFAGRFGQGTNINTGMRPALSLSAPGFMSARSEIRPWSSTDENRYFRGVATELSSGNFALMMFGSYNKIDASTEISSDSAYYTVKTLYSSGLHNSDDLLSRKDAVAVISAGLNLSYNFHSLRTGFTWSLNKFSLPFSGDKDKPEALYNFTGSINRTYSVYYNYLINRILLFGEISSNDFSSIALVQGITIRPSDRFSVNLLYRNYNPSYHTFTGRGPGSGSASVNERGILGNFSFEIAKFLFLNGGCDISYAPWLKYQKDFPSIAKRKELRLRYLPGNKLSADLSFTSRYNMYGSEPDRGVDRIDENIINTLKGIVRLALNDMMIATVRMDYKYSALSGNKGMQMYNDLNIRLKSVPLTIWFRYCIFKTDDWNSRLYTYENDLLNSFSIPALSGNGTRSYVMLKYEIGDFAEARIRYAYTEKSPEGQIPGIVSELKMQFRIWF